MENLEAIKKSYVRASARYEEVRGLTEEEKSYLPISLDKAALTFVFLRIKNLTIMMAKQREFKDYRDLLPMVFENKNIEFLGREHNALFFCLLYFGLNMHIHGIPVVIKNSRYHQRQHQPT